MLLCFSTLPLLASLRGIFWLSSHLKMCLEIWMNPGSELSLIHTANTTRVIWLHSYSHLHVIIVEHQPALSSGSNCPVASPPQHELLLMVFTRCFC